MITKERQHGDITEHLHDEYDFWHPITRVHKESNLNDLPADHVIAPVVQSSCFLQGFRALQVKPFDWTSWDAGCHAKGICQGYHSVLVQINSEPEPGHGWDKYGSREIHPIPEPGKEVQQQLHHRPGDPELMGIAEAYWQCPHCRKLQKPIQWAQGARLETYHIERRRGQTILWLKVSSGQWFVLIASRSIQIVAGNECGLQGTAYAVGNYPPQQMPDEIAITLARRFWYRIIKGYWSDRPTEDEK